MITLKTLEIHLSENKKNQISQTFLMWSTIRVKNPKFSIKFLIFQNMSPVKKLI